MNILLIKIKTFILQNTALKIKRQITDRKKYLQLFYLTRIGIQNTLKKKKLKVKKYKKTKQKKTSTDFRDDL